MAEKQNRDIDILESSTFSYSNLSLRVFGLWPFQAYKINICFRIGAISSLLSLLIPMSFMLYERRYDFNLILVSMHSWFFYMEIIIKYTYLVFNNNKLEKILNWIRRDFNTFKSKKLDILNDYAAKIAHYNHRYYVYLMVITLWYCMSFYESTILDFIKPLNESRPKTFMRRAKYHVSSLDENFNFVVIHGSIIDTYSMVLFAGYDTLLVNCSLHACALFESTTSEIQDCLQIQKNSLDKIKTGANVTKMDEDRFYNRLANAVRLHKYTLQYTTEVETTYTNINLGVLAISVMSMTFSEYQAVIHLKDSVGLVLTYCAFIFGELVHVFYFSWPGQLIHDYSLEVCKACYECEWYRHDIPDRCKQLLKLVMLRSQLPSKLTASNMYILNYESYGKILKASMSLITMLLSVN